LESLTLFSHSGTAPRCPPPPHPPPPPPPPPPPTNSLDRSRLSTWVLWLNAGMPSLFSFRDRCPTFQAFAIFLYMLGAIFPFCCAILFERPLLLFVYRWTSTFSLLCFFSFMLLESFPSPRVSLNTFPYIDVFFLAGRPPGPSFPICGECYAKAFLSRLQKPAVVLKKGPSLLFPGPGLAPVLLFMIHMWKLSGLGISFPVSLFPR